MSAELRQYDVAAPDGYPPEWHTTIKGLVREQAGHRCVRCGHPYPPDIAQTCPRGEWTPCDEQCTHRGPARQIVADNARIDSSDLVHQARFYVEHGLQMLARYRILTVHHLDGDKLNCRWWNLAALDQRCHLEIQGKVRLDVPWPWPHSEWFRPYVAGFYADKFGPTEIDRDDTEAVAHWLRVGAEWAEVERMPL